MVGGRPDGIGAGVPCALAQPALNSSTDTSEPPNS
jgi:hypothetical protein